jgi:hypothetical protein
VPQRGSNVKLDPVAVLGWQIEDVVLAASQHDAQQLDR